MASNHPAVSVRITPELLAKLDLLALTLNLKRSEALVEAIEQWVERERASTDTQDALREISEQAAWLAGDAK